MTATRVLALFLCAAAIWAWPRAGSDASVPAGRVTLSIVGTTDLHGRVFPRNGQGGVARFGGYLRNLRAARDEDGGAVLLLDAGDTFQGGIESNISEGALVVDAYNALGYDALAIGNHEFEFGALDTAADEDARSDMRGALKAAAARARFPFLAANIIDDATGRPIAWPNVKPSTMVEATGRASPPTRGAHLTLTARSIVKRLAILAAALVALLVVAIGLFLTSVPLNVPWRSMLQQMRALPAWLDPPPMSSAEAGRLVVPEGYAVSLFATGLPEARGLRVTERGDVVVTSPRDGRVMLLKADRDGDGRTDGRRVLVEGLDGPNGIDLADGVLYVGEEDGVGRIGFDDATGAVAGSYRRIIEGLPPGGNHWKKTIRVGPDGLLYVAVGSSCNVCVEEDARRAALLRFTTDGTFVDIYATGLRNSGGFDWSPVSGTLFATDNGRDLLGDDFPPCELNEVDEGGFYGWPYLNGANVPDPDLGAERPATLGEAIGPVHEFAAHTAPLGIEFLRHPRHPADYRHAAIVALHGSWNRTTKVGYKVVSLHVAADGTIEERDFLTGLLQEDTAFGRPADVAEGPDGSVYVSDDFGAAVYRIVPGSTGDAMVAVPRDGRGAAYDPSAVGTEAREAALADGPATMVAEGCVTCHAPSDAGEPAQVVLTDLAADYTLDEMVDYLARPNPPMPPYAADATARRQLAIYLLETYEGSSVPR